LRQWLNYLVFWFRFISSPGGFMQEKVNGLVMAWDDVGSGPAVVLIHGFPLCRRMWKPQVPALTAAGYRVIACDLRGFGESESVGSGLSMDLLADDVAALLDHLGIERAVIGGMSMGGYVLLNLIDRHPQRVAAALFMVTRAAADDEPGKLRRTSLAQEVAKGRPEVVTEAFEEILFASDVPSTRPDLIARVRTWMEATAPEGLKGGLLAMRDRRDYVDLLGNFNVPSLVIGAERDRAVPLEHSSVLAQGLPAARLCIIPGAGHMANLEQPEAFNRCVLEFLHHLKTTSMPS
jgi:pimeloyl-ACP methyl ester carboxylesterase